MTDLTHDSADDGFHEIQLSGKQLVFLFMATTVVSIVIFLCGVLVGRGVRTDAIAATPNADAALSAHAPISGSIAETTPTPSTDSPKPVDETPVAYPDRLTAAKPTPDFDSKPRAEERPTASPTDAPVSSKPAPVDAARPAAPAQTPPAAAAAQGGWKLQIVSLRDKAAASAIVQRLTSKGYPATLLSPAANAPAPQYKVHVGPYPDKAEAERVASRLRKEEQFNPWVHR